MIKTQTDKITATINGQEISALPIHSIIQALWQAGKPRIKNAGCLDGVCGSCAILVYRDNNTEITVELACQTPIENGMNVIFPLFHKPARRNYQLSEINTPDEVHPLFQTVFPEASQCRACGGCTTSCPKHIEVEQGVQLAAEGKFCEAGDLFFECVMCDACVSACPESINPNYVGLFSRRVSSHFRPRPANLTTRLEELRDGHLTQITHE